jgi:hypothetical protein
MVPFARRNFGQPAGGASDVGIEHVRITTLSTVLKFMSVRCHDDAQMRMVRATAKA